MRNWMVCVFVVPAVFLVSGCKEETAAPGLDASADRSPADIVPDIADIVDVPGLPDAPDIVDVSGLPDAPDIGGVGDVSDVSDTADVSAISFSVGENINVRESRPLSSGYEFPDEFFAALELMELPLSWLTFSDFKLTFKWDKSRLHWTDIIRHEGHKAPVFGYMVIEDVEKVVGMGDSEQTVRELLVAQHTYNYRDEFLVSRYDKEIVLSDLEYPLVKALWEFYKHPAVEGHPSPPTHPWSAVESDLMAVAEKIPVDVQVALAQAVYGLLAAADMRDEALTGSGKLSMEKWGQHHINFMNGFNNYSSAVEKETYPAVNLEKLSRAGQLATRSVESLRFALTGTGPLEGAALELTGPLGVIEVDLTGKDNSWERPDGFLLVDVGGNDTYLGSVAANTAIYYPVSVVLDVGGNDTYKPPKPVELGQSALVGTRAPMQGTGVFGIGILDDSEGDDSYECATACQGFGVFGVGVLMDHGGNDSYVGYQFSQGSSEFGFGLLFDGGGGDDEYTTLQHSQGYGGPRGMGWLVDDGGNDTYLAIEDPIIFDWAGEGTNFSGSQGFAFGFRLGPYWSGGLGALFDLGGDDSYQCAVMCMGFGYFFGTGLFYDKEGDDSYVNTHKYTMGAATHQSVGLFFDGQGADSYVLVGDDEAIGLGYDHGVACHIDRGGEDDVYTVDNVGDFVIGFARHPSMGVWINEGGDDIYNIPGKGKRCLGRSEVNEGDRDGPGFGVITLGMFMDLGGISDEYNVTDRPDVHNDGEWRQVDPLGQDWVPKLDFGYGFDSE